MKNLQKIRLQLISGKFEFSRHAFRRAVERNISELEIRQSGEVVEIIESYPEDKYAPSCLLLGFTKTGRPLHLQVSCLDAPILKIITLYEPDQARWYNYSQRRA
ncbi:MAG TPA: DUF4258 domain-containing protein [Anaerolineae bacterium]|nr:DUF4258 domain-containing protein [Anaerolineae bacterium]